VSSQLHFLFAKRLSALAEPLPTVICTYVVLQKHQFRPLHFS
jgi:hypothetical protein